MTRGTSTFEIPPPNTYFNDKANFFSQAMHQGNIQTFIIHSTETLNKCKQMHQRIR